MIGLPVQLEEPGNVAADEEEVARLIDDAQAAAPLIGEGLDPLHLWACALDVLDGVADRPAFAVARSLVAQPHAIKFEVLVDRRVGDDLVDGAWVHGVPELEHANQLAVEKHAEMHIAVVDDTA